MMIRPLAAALLVLSIAPFRRSPLPCEERAGEGPGEGAPPASAPISPSTDRAIIERWLYVAEDAAVGVYDIDHGHRLLRRIPVPGAGDWKGIGASVRYGHLYLTSHEQDELIAIDLASGRVVWRRHVGGYADSFAVSPDGAWLYVPLRHEAAWAVVDAGTGAVVRRIETEHGARYTAQTDVGVGPHNTWLSPDGARVYMEILTVPYVYVADTRTGRVLGKIGPFSSGVRPFTVGADERRLYANVDLLRGFETAELRAGRFGGETVRRLVARVPDARFRAIAPPPVSRMPHLTPSHGIALTPDGRELWVVDGVYGYLHVFAVDGAAPVQIASIPLTAPGGGWAHPGWVSFGIDGRYAYVDGGFVIDTRTRRLAARIPSSAEVVEVDFEGGKAIRAGHR
jgi:DNA-binding beta-propeller fold protein YncE